MKARILLIIAVVASLSACSFSSSFMRARHMPAKAPDALMVFGGANQDIYLGTLGEATDEDSIYNQQGKYGNPHSDLSISNKRSVYGSRDSEFSACNPHAPLPPIIVDKYNNVIGDFTSNARLKTALPDELIAPLRKLCKKG